MEQTDHSPEPHAFRHLNLLVILLGVCVLGVFALRAQLPTEPDWQLMAPSRDNLLVQHPLPWLMGDCYAHKDVLAALQATATTMREQGVPVVVQTLSSRRADSRNTGWTAELDYVTRTPNGAPAYAHPALLTLGAHLHYDREGVSDGLTPQTIDPAATLGMLHTLVSQPHAQVLSIDIHPDILRLLEKASGTLAPRDYAPLRALLREAPGRTAAMHVTFGPPAPHSDIDSTLAGQPK